MSFESGLARSPQIIHSKHRFLPPEQAWIIAYNASRYHGFERGKYPSKQLRIRSGNRNGMMERHRPALHQQRTFLRELRCKPND